MTSEIRKMLDIYHRLNGIKTQFDMPKYPYNEEITTYSEAKTAYSKYEKIFVVEKKKGGTKANEHDAIDSDIVDYDNVEPKIYVSGIGGTLVDDITDNTVYVYY